MRFPAAALVLCSLALSSCSLAGGVRVFAGVYRFRRGDYAASEALFERAAETGGPLVRDYARFGAGCVLLSRGDTDAALRAFASVSPAAPPQLVFAAAYNSGAAAFRAGDPARARAFFIQALRVNPRSSDAKINLELTLEALARAASSADERAEAGGEAEAAGEEGALPPPAAESAVFPLVRELEAHLWQSVDAAPAAPGVIDY